MDKSTDHPNMGNSTLSPKATEKRNSTLSPGAHEKKLRPSLEESQVLKQPRKMKPKK